MSCGTCGCSEASKPVQFKCECGDDCSCATIEFDEDPKSTPFCCGQLMKRIK